MSNWCVVLDRCWLGGANSAVRPAAISCVSIHCVSLKHESKRCNVKRALVAVKHAIRQIFNVMYVYVRDTVRVATPPPSDVQVCSDIHTEMFADRTKSDWLLPKMGTVCVL